MYISKPGEKSKISDFLLKDCLPREMHIDYFDSHKALIGKAGKKIHSATPHALKIKRKSFDEEWTSWLFIQKEVSKIRNVINSFSEDEI